MLIDDGNSVQEQYREASFQYDTKSGTEDIAMSFLVLSIFALIATFVCDLSAFELLYVWLARAILFGVIVSVFISGYRSGTKARATERTMSNLRKDNPDVPLPF